MSGTSWSLVFSAATFVVIAATAIAALVQLRHLRSSNQLSALLTVMELWNEPALQRHMTYVHGDLQAKLEQGYLAEVRADGANGWTSRTARPEFLVMDFWEQIGAFTKYRLIDERSLLDLASSPAWEAWKALEPIVACVRERRGNSVYENFEYLAVRSRIWVDRYPDGTYPPRTPRMSELRAKRNLADSAVASR